ncbi:hypothetical protein N311_05583, partial [Apaloderma vittatum]
SSKNIHLTDSLGIVGMVDEKQSQHSVVMRVQRVHSKRIQE